MIQRKTQQGWDGVPVTRYRIDGPQNFRLVDRHTLFQDSGTKFETRVFEIGPGGYSSFEKHQHEHCAVVLAGHGRVRLHDAWFEIGPEDAIHVPGMTPHQFENTGDTPMRLLCVVDRERDRPIFLDAEPALGASEPR